MKNKEEEKQISFCKKHFNSGHCPFGFKCRFSHSLEELTKQRKINGTCNAFFYTGACKIGMACKFAHDEVETKEQSN